MWPASGGSESGFFWTKKPPGLNVSRIRELWNHCRPAATRPKPGRRGDRLPRRFSFCRIPASKCTLAAIGRHGRGIPGIARSWQYAYSIPTRVQHARHREEGLFNFKLRAGGGDDSWGGFSIPASPASRMVGSPDSRKRHRQRSNCTCSQGILPAIPVVRGAKPLIDNFAHHPGNGSNPPNRPDDPATMKFGRV
jgi:hypothetical protein